MRCFAITVTVSLYVGSFLPFFVFQIVLEHYIANQTKKKKKSSEKKKSHSEYTREKVMTLKDVQRATVEILVAEFLQSVYGILG